MAQQGSFIANVYTSNSSIPIAGATVIVTRKAAGQNEPELLGLQITDGSGRTRAIAIPTPDASVSQQPEGGVGWTTIDVSAHHPRYEQIFVHGVQVFPGVETVQNFQLIPLALNPEIWNRSESFDIPPQEL
ncbi:MAG: spore cortex-lytic protein [Ruminococcaceae bacterium]|nr:spore cortex-lytic protein [Oscillospiraceae bacterium]